MHRRAFLTVLSFAFILRPRSSRLHGIPVRSVTDLAGLDPAEVRVFPFAFQKGSFVTRQFLKQNEANAESDAKILYFAAGYAAPKRC